MPEFLESGNMLIYKWDFAEVNKLKILIRGNYLGLARWAQYNHKSLWIGDTGNNVIEKQREKVLWWWWKQRFEDAALLLAFNT